MRNEKKKIIIDKKSMSVNIMNYLCITKMNQ